MKIKDKAWGCRAMGIKNWTKAAHTQDGAAHTVIVALGGYQQEEEELKVIFDYIVSSRPT